MKPYLALPLFQSQKPFIYELDEYLGVIEFSVFNRPKGDPFDTLKEDKLGQVRLPHTFSHWTYKATGGLVMIADVYGWRLDRGKYLMTDPIVFTNEEGQLGHLVDWGTDGMQRWIAKHECNNVCEEMSMADPALIAKIESILKRFKNGKIADILRYLDMISIGQGQAKK